MEVIMSKQLMEEELEAIAGGSDHKKTITVNDCKIKVRKNSTKGIGIATKLIQAGAKGGDMITIPALNISERAYIYGGDADVFVNIWNLKDADYTMIGSVIIEK